MKGRTKLLLDSGILKVDPVFTQLVKESKEAVSEGYFLNSKAKHLAVYSLSIYDLINWLGVSERIIFENLLEMLKGKNSDTNHFHRTIESYKKEKDGKGFPFTIHEPFPFSFLRIEQSSLIVFYSGGLESSIMSVLSYGPDVVFVNVSDIDLFRREHGIPLYEPVFMLMTPFIGGHTAHMGLEYAEDKDCTLRYYEYGSYFVDSFSEMLGISVCYPLEWMKKLEIFNVASERKIPFKSCSVSGWCGHCFKCFQIGTMYLAFGKKIPFDVDTEIVTKFIGEIEKYRVDHIDPHCLENWEFLEIEKVAGLKISELWERERKR